MYKPTEVMRIRHRRLLEKSLPAVDLEDMGKNRQFAPEYSSCVYERMLEQQIALGDYLEKPHPLSVTRQ